MNRMVRTGQGVQEFSAVAAKQLAGEVSPWVCRLSRLGYAARGVIYLIIGGLAARAALGAGGETTESKGALRTLHEQPFGKALLVLMTVGLLGYALWRFVQAIRDPEHEGSDLRGIGKRTGHFGAGVLHLGLVVYSVGLLTGGALGDASEGGSPRSWSATFMSWPGGRILVGVVGLGAIGFGVHQLVRAWRAEIDRELDLDAMREGVRTATIAFGRAGLAARGVVSGIVGAGLGVAALRVDPSEAKGVDDALRAVQAMPFGWGLLALVGLGLAAYGGYQLMEARYRRIRVC